MPVIQIVGSSPAVLNIGSEPGLSLRSAQKLPELPDLGHRAAGPGAGRGPQVQDVQDGPPGGAGGAAGQLRDSARVREVRGRRPELR